jgi:hypothetical protein
MKERKKGGNKFPINFHGIHCHDQGSIPKPGFHEAGIATTFPLQFSVSKQRLRDKHQCDETMLSKVHNQGVSDFEERKICAD